MCRTCSTRDSAPFLSGCGSAAVGGGAGAAAMIRSKRALKRERKEKSGIRGLGGGEGDGGGGIYMAERVFEKLRGKMTFRSSRLVLCREAMEFSLFWLWRVFVRQNDVRRKFAKSILWMATLADRLKCLNLICRRFRRSSVLYRAERSNLYTRDNARLKDVSDKARYIHWLKRE